jgi:integrase
VGRALQAAHRPFGQTRRAGRGRPRRPQRGRSVSRSAPVLPPPTRRNTGPIERERKFSGHSLRAGLASSAEVDERYVQKQLGHASAEMTRRYQRRRDRFRVNLTKAAGL